MNLYMFAAIALVVLMALTLYRVVTGPTVYDRFLGVGLSGTTAVFAMALLGFWFERPELFSDILLSYGLLNFIGVVAAAKYLEKRKDAS